MTEITSQTAQESLTAWWREMGVEPDEALIRAYRRHQAGAAKSPAGQGAAVPAQARKGLEDRVAEARQAAAACQSLEALAAAIAAFDGCPLKEGARSTVVMDGVASADIMVIGEGPGAEEDRMGKPFVGKAGQLLDRMLAAIGLSRETNTLITNVNYWRPPANRNPEADELTVCRPFVDRMIALTAPRLIIAAGGVSAKSLLGSEAGIMRLRGTEHTVPVDGAAAVALFPILHPAFLLRRPQEKSRAWRDLQLIERRARELDAKT